MTLECKIKISATIPVFYPRILVAICTLGLAGRSYLFSYPKYGTEYISEARIVGGSYFLTENVRCNIYLRSGLSYAGQKYLFAYLK